MPGLYLHIPFCKQACHYCNFHFSTSLKLKTPLLDALRQEIYLQRDYLQGAPLESIYLGGGTPSLLETAELTALFESIRQHYPLEDGAEITLEANPDDISLEKLRDWKNYTPINRLSIGIQSFSEEDLLWMHRAHNAREARICLDLALETGFDNLTVDLIYGAPTTSDAQWRENLRTVLDAGVPHLSCYSLTVEEGTALAHSVRKGQAPPADEQKSARQLDWLMAETARCGYEHYEISNFALPGRYARHNSNYWTGAHYLGIGPSAHSFNGVSRQWNVANNAGYIRAIEAGQIPFEIETLTPAQRYNEYVMTGLRTQWGCEEKRIQALGEPMAGYFFSEIQALIAAGKVEKTAEKYRLTREGKFLADRIASDLFWVANV